MEAVIGVPCMQQMDFYFVNSLLNLQRPLDSGFCLLANSLVYDAREQIVDIAIEHNSEYVLWLDSDMVVPADAYVRLKEHNKDIICGLYFSRIQPYEPVLFKDIKLDNDFSIINKGTHYYDYPTDRIFQVDAAGMGCMLIKTAVLKRIKDTYTTVFHPFLNISEDASFCQRAKKLGYEIWCDPGVKCGHVGAAIIQEDTYQLYQSMQEGNHE